MSWIDIAIIALVVLFGLAGVLKGVKKSALSLGAFLVAFVLAFFLANVVAEAFMGIEGVKNFVVGNGVGEGANWSLAQAFYAGLSSEGGMPAEDSYLYTKFYAPILERIIAANVQIDLTQGLAIYLAFLVFSAIIGVGLFLVARFLLMIVTAIVKSYIGKKKSVASRLCGLLVGFVRGGMWAIAGTFVLSCICGLTFISFFQSIENEYEHPNKVLCGVVNDAAYGLRNSLYLPSADMYGRIVNLAYQKEPVDPAPDETELDLNRLQLFVDVSNLNYQSQPWSIDKNHKRVFDENNALTLNTYESVGFKAAIEAIMAYNTAAAAKIDDRSVTIEESTVTDYSGFVQTNSTSLYNKLNNFMNKLGVYATHYADGLELTDETAINSQNRILENDYTAVTAALAELFNSYGNVQTLFGEFPAADILALVPETSLTVGTTTAA